VKARVVLRFTSGALTCTMVLAAFDVQAYKAGLVNAALERGVVILQGDIIIQVGWCKVACWGSMPPAESEPTALSLHPLFPTFLSCLTRGCADLCPCGPTHAPPRTASCPV
jgi:hypothetical protein